VHCSPAIRLTLGSRLLLLPSGMYGYSVIRMVTARVARRRPVGVQADDGGPEFYSIPQAAALLGVSRMTLWRWISAGDLAVLRLGHRTSRILRSDLEQFVLSRKAGQRRRQGTMEPKVAPAAWAIVGHTEHFVQFYEHEYVLLEAVSGFVGAALRAKEAAVVLATPAHRKEVERRLLATGLDVAAEQDAGRFVSLDAVDLLAQFMVDGSPDAARFNEVVGGIIANAGRGGRHVRAFGEIVALLVAAGNESAAIRLEGLWNELQHRTGAFSLFCAYPMDTLGEESLGEAVRQVCAEHSQVIPAESYTDLDAPADRQRAIAVLQQKARALQSAVEERKSAEDQLRVALVMERDAREETQAALQLRDEFLSIASHELRTPLTALNVQAQLALQRIEEDDQLDRERVLRALRSIRGHGDKLARLLGRLLDISRLESGNLGIQSWPTDLCALVGAVVEAGESWRHRHDISIDCPDSLNATVDSLRLEQVLINLLENAVKFSPNGGSIQVALRQAEAGLVELSVRDHGLGIPTEKRGSIFERYFQAHSDAHRGGMGLGLYISRQIVELHGGEIWAEFPPDGGTRVVMQLPTGRPDRSMENGLDITDKQQRRWP
jgi:excisionase family DNA binding protein